MAIPLPIIKSLAPTGALRASINLGNPLLAAKDAVTGQPFGVSVDLSRAFAERLGLSAELHVFEKAGLSVEAVTRNHVDIGFFAIDPLRGAGVIFTAPYVLIEGAYLVRDDSPIRANHEVDQAGIRVVVGQASSYDLFLSRELRQAQIVRAANSQRVVDDFIEQGFEVAAGVRQQLEADARRVPGLRLLPGQFMAIRQAMVLPRSRGDAAADCLFRFVEEMKASGFIADSLRRHGIQGVSIAPAALGAAPAQQG